MTRRRQAKAVKAWGFAWRTEAASGIELRYSPTEARRVRSDVLASTAPIFIVGPIERISVTAPKETKR